MEMPIECVYEDVMDLLNGVNQSSEEMKAKMSQYKDKIIGKTALISAPQEYFNIGLIIETNIHLHHWEQYDLHRKAKVMARHYLKNMLEVINAHYNEQDRIEEDTKRKNAESNHARLEEARGKAPRNKKKSQA